MGGGTIKSEMYQMYEITDEASLLFAIKDYMRFYCKERPQDRYQCKPPLEVRIEALISILGTFFTVKSHIVLNCKE